MPSKLVLIYIGLTDKLILINNYQFYPGNCYIFQFLPTAQKHGTYLKPWNHEFRHSRCRALGVCNEFHGKQKCQMKMSLDKLANIQVC